jgi:threonine/homoserine/homoserine lactone efflux protein
MDGAGYPAFPATCLVVELTPGPNMACLALVAATEGRRRGLAAVAGVAPGLALAGLAAALGLAALVSASPVLWQGLRWTGMAYLLWLARQTWAGGEAAENAADANAPPATHFRRGRVNNLLNPKAALFYVAVQPAFLPETPRLAEVLAFSASYVAVATAVHASIVALACTLHRRLSGAGQQTALRRAGALALAAVALWLLWATRQP